MLFETTDQSYFFEFEGDLTRFNSFFIGEGEDEELEYELEKLIFNNRGEIIPDILERPTKDWGFFVRCGAV